MARRLLLLIGIALGASLFLDPARVLAQEPPKTVNETTLRVLYRQHLRNPADAYIQKRIADERAAIHSIIVEEIRTTIEEPAEETPGDTQAITRAVDRQKAVIATLEDRLGERRVDLEILQAEEARFYVPPEGTLIETGALLDAEKYRLTKTHDELLAKKAILEERLNALQSSLLRQEERLQRLVLDQRISRFHLFLTVAKYLLILLAILFFEKMIRTRLLARIAHAERRYTAVKHFTTTVYLLTVIWLAAALFSKNPGILASFAIIGAGLAIALQDVVKDIVGWMVIMQQRAYETGDRISVGTLTGEVVDIDVLRTTLLEVGLPPESSVEHTGKILTIPNSFVLTQPVTNHSKTSDFVNAEIRLTITYESDWRKAKTLLEKILTEETTQYTERERAQQLYRTRLMLIRRQVLGPRVFLDIADDGVLFMLRFPAPIGEKRTVVTALTEKILTMLEKTPDIELAYRTVRSISWEERKEKMSR